MGRAPRRLLALAAAAAALGVPAAPAHAAAPQLQSVGETLRHPTASWSLPAGVLARVVEVATSSATGADGSFDPATVAAGDVLDDAQTSWTGGYALAPGTYYVHVAGYDGVQRAWSQTLPLVVPPYATVTLVGSGSVSSAPTGVACPGACSAELPPGAVTLTARPAPGFVFGSWSGDGCAGVAPACTLALGPTSAPTVVASFIATHRTTVHLRTTTLPCLRSLAVGPVSIAPLLDADHPFAGLLTLRLRGVPDTGGPPLTRASSRRAAAGIWRALRFAGLRPGRYTVVARYAGDRWRPPATVVKRARLGRC
jgi:hypothetical protein